MKLKLDERFLKKAFWLILIIVYIFVLAKLFVSWKKTAQAQTTCNCTVSIKGPIGVNIEKPTMASGGEDNAVSVYTANPSKPEFSVRVWSPGGEGSDKSPGFGVYVYNAHDDPLTVRCYPQDPICAYFTRLSTQEKDKQTQIENLDDAVKKDLMTEFTTDCPTYAKIAGVGEPEEEGGDPAVVDNIKESICRIAVDNWADIVVGGSKAVKMSIAEAFEGLDFIDAITRKFLIKNTINSANRYQEAPEQFRAGVFFYDTIGGTWVEPGTGFLALNRRLTRPMSTARLVLSTQQYLGGEFNRAESGLMEELRSGGGYFGKYRCASEVTNKQTGEKSCGKMEINALSGDIQHLLQTLTEASLDVFVNTVDYNQDIANELLPSRDPYTGLVHGGWPGYRDLLNSFSGGPGFFRYTPSGGFQPKPEEPVSFCEISNYDPDIVMGLDEQRKVNFKVYVGLSNGLDGLVSDLEQIIISLPNSSFATTSPSLLRPTGATSSEIFLTEVVSSPNQRGTTKINILAELKESAGGNNCTASIDLEVLGFERYLCDSQRCKSPLINNDPDEPVYTCVGTPNDDLNNDCTPLGSNAITEWCVDIGDKDGDGYNAYCYDSAPADQQLACQARGYICQATTSAVFAPRKIGLFESAKKISYEFLNLFKFE
ncbi:MAG: hypothetical protein AB1721_02000 [Patescibacteria group bacterium]